MNNLKRWATRNRCISISGRWRPIRTIPTIICVTRKRNDCPCTRLRSRVRCRVGWRLCWCRCCRVGWRVGRGIRCGVSSSVGRGIRCGVSSSVGHSVSIDRSICESAGNGICFSQSKCGGWPCVVFVVDLI